MADFDLSAVIRIEDEGTAAAGAALAQSIDSVDAAQKRAAGSASTLAGAAGSAAASIESGVNASRGGSASLGSLDDAQRKTAGSSDELARRQRSTADAINQVVRATNPAVSNQNLLDAAVRRVQSAYIQGKVSAETYARAQEIASRATFNATNNLDLHARASTGSRIAQMEMMHVVRSASDQFAFGTPILQIFTMHIAQLAQAYAFSAQAANDTVAPTARAAAAADTAAASIEAEGIAAAGAAGEAEGLAAAMAAGTAVTGVNTVASEANAAAKGVEAEATGAATVATEANTVATVANATATEEAAVVSGGFGAFMSGPYGMALIAVTVLVGTLTNKLLQNADATHEAEIGADALGKAQSVLGGMFDMTSGKLEHQNELLIANARLTAIKLRAEGATKRAEAAETFSSAIDPKGGMFGQAVAWTRGLGDINNMGERLLGPLIQNVQNAKTPAARAAAIDAALRASEKLGTPGVPGSGTDPLKNLTNISTDQFRQALINVATADQNESIAGLIDQSLNSGSLAPGLKRDARAKHPRAKKGKDPAVLENWGLDESDRITNLAASFADVPPQVEKVRKANEDLDKVLRDVERRKPPNMAALITQVQEARVVINDGLNKPYNEFILKQNDALGVEKLLAEGRDDEANALKIILDLEAQQGPLSQAQKDGVLATVQALRAEQREVEILHEKQQKYLTALNSVKDAVHNVFTDPLKGIEDLPKRMISAFTQLRADKLFESMFGDTFRQLQDKITGADVAKDAAERMATAVDGVTAQTDRTTAALDALASSAGRAASGLSGAPLGSAAGPTGSRLADLQSVVDGLSDDGSGASGAAGIAAGVVGSLAGARRTVNNAAAGNDKIVVHGDRSTVQNFSGWIEKLSKGVGISDAAASKIGSFAGKGVEGAATGAMVNSFLRPLGKALGFKTSQTGAEIGGAIGSFVPIPGGQIIGSIAGSIIGGLFKKTVVKSGGATITSAFDPATMSGNNSDAKKVAGGAGTDVQDAIVNIAQQLGGTPGAFKISIGEANGKWSVDPLGLGRSAKPGKGGVAFGDDQAGATAFAIQTAVAQGAVGGLSKAVAAALQSSPDINKALAEALNVKNLEELIGGLGSQLVAQFRNFDAQAAERVRLAKKYGLDLLKVEQINGEQRTALVDQITQQRIGSLLDFQKSMLFGDLFEGDAQTRRSAILDQISKIAPDAEAGKDGAAGQLSDLYQKLLTSSRDAFGTAGPEYASDRASATDEIAKVIQIENDRIAAAAAQQQTQTDALTTNNDLTNETNDLLAITNSKLDTLIGQSGGSISTGSDLAAYVNSGRFTDLTSRVLTY